MAQNAILLAALSTWHIVVLLLIVLLLFGGRKLPELAKGLARGMRIFRDELHGVQHDIQEPPAEKPQADDKTLASKDESEQKKS